MKATITDAQYRTMAELRHQIRLFLQKGEIAAQSQGIEMQQYQVLLAIRGTQTEGPCTIRALSERLLLKHHSTVELIDRLEAKRLVSRCRDEEDRRKVFVTLQPKAERILEAIVRTRLADIQTNGRTFVRTLQALVDRSTSNTAPARAKQAHRARRVSARVGQAVPRIAAD